MRQSMSREDETMKAYQFEKVRAEARAVIRHWRDEGDTAPLKELIRDAFINIKWRRERDIKRKHLGRTA